MTPRTVTFMLDDSTPITNKLLLEIKEEGYSRIPVFRKNRDKITGFVHVRDLLGAETGILKDYAQPIISVPNSMRLDTLKNLLLTQQQHLAVLTNEYGAFEGLVALEDILEEVIGREILDEDDDIPDLQEFARQQHLAAEPHSSNKKTA